MDFILGVIWYVIILPFLVVFGIIAIISLFQGLLEEGLLFGAIWAIIKAPFYPFKVLNQHLQEQEEKRLWEEQRPVREAAELEQRQQQEKLKKQRDIEYEEERKRQALARAEAERQAQIRAAQEAERQALARAEAERQAQIRAAQEAERQRREEEQRREHRRLAKAYKASQNPSVALRTCKCHFDNPGDAKACNQCNVDLFDLNNYLARWKCCHCGSVNAGQNQTCHGCHGETRPPDYMWEILY